MENTRKNSPFGGRSPWNQQRGFDNVAQSEYFSRFVKADLHNPSCSSTSSRPRHSSHSLHFIASSAAAPWKNCHLKIHKITSKSPSRCNTTQRRNSVCHNRSPQQPQRLIYYMIFACCRSAPVMLKQAQTACVGEQQPIGTATQPPVCRGPWHSPS